MKIVLIGADGQLGTDLLTCLKGSHEVHAWTYPDVDITRPQELGQRFKELKPDLLINTAAYNRVDAAEEDPGGAFSLNALAVRVLALLCRDTDTALMHFSSDYVFDGSARTPYTEDDAPNPLNVYGVSKVAGEHFVRSILSRFYLVRTCGLYGTAGCWGKGTNFVDSMVRLAQKEEPIRVVNDQWVTPTSTHELAHRLAELIETGRFGLYHMTNSGQCTWFEFAREIFRILDLEPILTGVDTVAFEARARRPAYSVLENRNAQRIGLQNFAPWTDALPEYLAQKGYLK
ncbi:MAG: dTDP-4-dehydrorhamnose reductase [Candidatus Aminicenantaceae bacterium]